ncbi:unnamed protein product [Caenorhabditis brenneri]
MWRFLLCLLFLGTVTAVTDGNISEISAHEAVIEKPDTSGKNGCGTECTLLAIILFNYTLLVLTCMWAMKECLIRRKRFDTDLDLHQQEELLGSNPNRKDPKLCV